MVLETQENFLYLNSASYHPLLDDTESVITDRDFTILKDLTLERQLILMLHFFGLGLLVTSMVAGFILNNQYKKAKDLPTKATILRSLKPIGLLSPFASLIMLISGIGNMHMLGYSILELPGWLAYKIVFYALAVISGILFGVKGKKRGALIQQMSAQTAPANADELLRGYEKQITLSYIVMPIIFLIILYLSILGRLGVQ